MTKAREIAELGDTLTADGSGNIDIAGTITSDGLTVDSSVGIGTSSPSSPLTVVDSNSSAGFGIPAAILRQSSAAGNNGLIVDVTNTPDQYVADFRIGNTSKVRIDSSGNLLVGKTSVDGAITAGIEIRSDNTLRIARNNTSLVLNRLSTDGNIAEFKKDGTTVGSIGSYAGASLSISKGSSGLLMDNSVTRVLPFNGATNAPSDAAVTLGGSSNRFKDLYLSGTVNAATLNADGGTIKLDGNYPVGTGNVALGNTALDDPALSGGYNTAIGNATLTLNSTGSNNTAIGYEAGNQITSGAQNTLVGVASGRQTTTGNYNAGVGNGTLYDTTTGSNNTGIGWNALRFNTTASNNTAVGYKAAYANTTGTEITAVGKSAMSSNTTGNYNTAVGYQTMLNNTTGSDNTAYGDEALRNNTSGGKNTVSGNIALYSNTTGNSNTAFGMQALFSNTTASNNTAVGYQAGYSNTTGKDNVLIGRTAGVGQTTAVANTFVGTAAGGGVTTGSYNTFVGSGEIGVTAGAGEFVTTGDKNTILGRYSGNQGGLDIRTSSNNIVLSDGDGNPVFWHDGGNSVLLDGNTKSSFFNYGIGNHFQMGFHILNFGGSSASYIDTGVKIDYRDSGGTILVLASRNTGAGTATESALYVLKMNYDGNNAPSVYYISGSSNFVTFGTTGSSPNTTITCYGNAGGNAVYTFIANRT